MNLFYDCCADHIILYQTFIFVRPPPSKSNHPLNLQVQLVPPKTKPPGGVISNNDSTTTPTSANPANSKFTADGAPLARTSSSRSSIAYTSTSYGSSTASFSSFSSTSGRRTIIPLYNLQAHNVMTNVIVDAGTDAKIAKFQKRGIELIDLALLEPVEVWGEGGREKDVRRESMRIVADEMGASVVVNAGGGRGILSAKSHTGFLQPEGPINPSATSSATSLHSQIVNSTTQTPIPQYLASQTMATDHYTPPPSAKLPISRYPDSIIPTPVPPESPASLTSVSLAMMSPPSSPAPGSVSGKRKLFNKLFNKKQNGSSLLSPSGSVFPGSPGQQQSFAQPQSPPATGSNSPNLEMSPPPSFASFTLLPAPVTKKTINSGDRSFSSRRSNSMKIRSIPPPTLIEPVPVSPFATSGFTSPSLGAADSMSPPIEQQKTPTQKSVAAGGAKTKTTKSNTIVSPPPTPILNIVEVPREPEREMEKGHGRGMSLASITSPFRSTLKSRLSNVVMGGGGNSQGRDSGSNMDKFPTSLNMKGSDRDTSPHPSVESRSRSSLVFTSSTNNSADSHGDGGFTANGTGGIGQAQADIMMNLRQQQLQLRPPVLGIQPTFVSSSSNPSTNPFSPDGPSATTTTENSDQLFGQRALMYVWLVRRWMKKRTSSFGGGLSGLGDSAVGFLGGLKGEKEKEKRSKEKMKDKFKRKSSADFRPGSSHGGGLAAVTAPLMYGGVEVRFEWKRARVKEKDGSRRKKKTRNGRERTGTTGSVRGAESDGEVVETSMERDDDDDDGDDFDDERGSIRGGTPLPKTKTKERLKSEEKKKYRMSTGSINSITASMMDGVGEFETKKGNRYDDGEDSDPEDSETPWICTLKLRRGAGPSTAAGDNAQQPPVLQTRVLRIKVGTVSPTPHHPKVVAMLKVPFPLPDIEVERMGVVKRQGGMMIPPQQQQSSTYNGLVLTAEEIKDVVCSTGIWLVVREGFGGVGRVSRKGDGWRIRP